MAQVEHKKHIITHTHTHTHIARTHFDVGTGTVGLPSLQALVGAGAFAFVTHFSRGGLRTIFGGGGVELTGLGGCFFLCFAGGFLLEFFDTGLTKCNSKLQVCHAMLCSVVVCCGLVKCKVVWCVVL